MKTTTAGQSAGHIGRSSGVASIMSAAALPADRRPRFKALLTALRAMRIPTPGLKRRGSGVVITLLWAVLLHHLPSTTAIQDTPTGSTDGLRARRCGAVSTVAAHALRQATTRSMTAMQASRTGKWAGPTAKSISVAKRSRRAVHIWSRTRQEPIPKWDL